MAKLVVLSESLAGKIHELTVDTTTVGRVEDNAFQIPEASVSSHHAEIIKRGSEIVIRDLNSTNGTFINGQQITGEGVLKPGQILRLGQIELRLEDGAAAASDPAAPAKSPQERSGQEIARSHDGHSARREARSGTANQGGVIRKRCVCQEE
jgi:hypothetical protein